jgi:hypothetical protein
MTVFPQIIEAIKLSNEFIKVLPWNVVASHAAGGLECKPPGQLHHLDLHNTIAMSEVGEWMSE